MGGTPYAAAYDATHNLIFASNPDWNRVDVISNVTHKIVKSIPVRSPRGLDITQDNSRVWVQTASSHVFAIDTTSLQASHYMLPSGPVTSSGMPISFATDRLLALSDGTLFIYFADSGGYIGAQVGVWNPQTNQMKVLQSGLVFAFGTPVRSGDGTLVYAVNATTNASGMYVYKVASQTLSTFGAGTVNWTVMTVNRDGSKLVMGTLLSGLQMYDSSFTPLGALPGTLPSSGSPINVQRRQLEGL
jgi:DNA-binding beta-propeller fold protein YncE